VAAEPHPKSIGRYEIIRLLGRGGMGEVYLASDSALGRRVAIKILPTALQSDAKMRGRFMNEARAVAALNHPNVITIHDLATTDARPLSGARVPGGRRPRRDHG
jgi:serine/threonine protein kinase